jgi:fumarate reductase subunit D
MIAAAPGSRRPDLRGRGHPGYVAFVAHRVSGLALVLFLPFHFWALGTALAGSASLDAFLAWTANPLVKATETLLVFALATHLGLGLRLLVVEFTGWRSGAQASMLATAAALAVAVALLFALNVA